MSSDVSPAAPPSMRPAVEAGAWREDPAPEDTDARRLARRPAYLRECAAIAISYLIGGACVGLFAVIGTVPFSAPLMFLLGGWAVTACIAWLIARGRTVRWKDSSGTAAQAAASLALFLLGMVLYPQINFAFALCIFTVFIAATYRMPAPVTFGAWAVVSLLVAAATIGQGHPLQMPSGTRAEQWVSWLCVVTVLARCVVLSLVNMTRTLAIRDRGRQMAETLREIERLASHDELTGTLNRRAVHQALRDEMARTERSGTPLGIALIDLDHFKRLNDTWGHPAGDRALQLFADAMRGCARATDRFGRHGGEEFLLVLIDTDTPQAERAVERLRSALQRIDWRAVSPDRVLTFSAGVARYRSGESLEQFVARADRALYEAKHAGRNCTRVA